MSKVLIGYVHKWNYLNEDIKSKLAGEPKEGSIYRIVYTEGTDADKTYMIYIGKDSNPAKMDTIFLGNGDSQVGDKKIEGTYYDKWEFDISLINKDNYLEFDYKAEELPVLKQWLDSDNSDLKDLLNNSPRAVDIQNMSTEASEMDSRMQDVIRRVADKAVEYDKAMEKMSKSLNIIVSKDDDTALAISELLTYIASTYRDKYEASGKPNLSKQFLMSSDTSDGILYNVFKYLQRYTTKGFSKSGKIVDIHKAIHFLIFELQRSKNQKTNDKN